MICFTVLILSLLLFRGVKTQECDWLSPPDNGYFVGGYCSNQLQAACVINCNAGYKSYGSTYRQCLTVAANNQTEATWTGTPTFCEIKRCPDLESTPTDIFKVQCSTRTFKYGTSCNFSCAEGYRNVGSRTRICMSIGYWSGIRAKCQKIKGYVPTTGSTSTIALTTKEEIHYHDLTNETLFFGYSFKPVKLETHISELPATFSIWARTNYTANIRVLTYMHDCTEFAIYTDSNSSLLINFNRKYNYKLVGKYLHRNKWTQLVIVQNINEWNLFIDGAIQLDMNQLKIGQECPSVPNKSAENEFMILDLDNSEMGSYEPMRAEITRVYLWNRSHSEEEVLQMFFYACETTMSDFLVFDWANVPIGTHLREFKRRDSSFCRACSLPTIPKYSAINYEGIRSGSVRSYKCVRGFEMVGYSSSVCMAYGGWSHKTPRCKINRQEFTKYQLEAERSRQKIQQNGLKLINDQFHIVIGE